MASATTESSIVVRSLSTLEGTAHQIVLTIRNDLSARSLVTIGTA